MSMLASYCAEINRSPTLSVKPGFHCYMQPGAMHTMETEIQQLALMRLI